MRKFDAVSLDDLANARFGLDFEPAQVERLAECAQSVGQDHLEVNARGKKNISLCFDSTLK